MLPNNDFMIDGRGQKVPTQSISTLQIIRNELVEKCVLDADKLQAHIKRKKRVFLSEIAAFLDIARAEYDVKVQGEMGNFTLFSFDNKKKLVVQLNERTFFEPEKVQIARALFTQCLERWTDRPEARAMLRDALAADKQGKINQFRLFRVMRIESDDDQFNQAKAILKDSISVMDNKSYVRFYKKDKRGNWKSISLNFSGL